MIMEDPFLDVQKQLDHIQPILKYLQKTSLTTRPGDLKLIGLPKMQSRPPSLFRFRGVELKWSPGICVLVWSALGISAGASCTALDEHWVGGCSRVSEQGVP